MYACCANTVVVDAVDWRHRHKLEQWQSACMTWHCVQGFRFDNLDIPSPKAASPLLACQGPDKLCGATDWTVASGMYVISIDFPGYVCIAHGTEVLWVTTPSAVSGCYVKYPEGTSP
jgi:hypothetical protein